jgi:hypothetical protein
MSSFSFLGKTFNLSLDSSVESNISALNEGANKSLKLSTDACNVMGTIGAVTPDQKTAVTAVETETQAVEMMSAMSNSAGQLTEAVSTTKESVNTAQSKIETVTDLAARLRSAGKNQTATDLETALSRYLDAVEGKVTKVNSTAGESATETITEVNTNITQAEEKMTVCTQELGGLVTATGGLNCKKIQQALLDTKYDANGNVGEMSKTVKSNVPKYTRTIDGKGRLVNYNIDRKKPYRDVMTKITVRESSSPNPADDEMVFKEVLVRVYATQEQLNEKFGPATEGVWT